MKIKKIFTRLPLLASLFLMGCSYGCSSSNDSDPVYEESEGIEEEETWEGSEVEADFEGEELEEEVQEEEPVVPAEPQSAPEEGFVDQDDEVPETPDEGESSEEESAQDYKPANVDRRQEQEEDYESEEEEYIDDGGTYEDDYPGS